MTGKKLITYYIKLDFKIPGTNTLIIFLSSSNPLSNSFGNSDNWVMYYKMFHSCN